MKKNQTRMNLTTSLYYITIIIFAFWGQTVVQAVLLLALGIGLLLDVAQDIKEILSEHLHKDQNDSDSSNKQP